MQFFGDSFDVVKRFLLHVIDPGAEWSALPMFTHAVTSDDLKRLAAFLGVRVVSSSVLAPNTDRAAYFSVLANHDRVFLDPDKGINLTTCGGAAAPSYVFGQELTDLCLQAPSRIVVSFDQSLPRGRELEKMSGKLAYFHEAGLSGFAYQSHACFVVLSVNATLSQGARDRLLASGLPRERITA